MILRDGFSTGTRIGGCRSGTEAIEFLPQQSTVIVRYEHLGLMAEVMNLPSDLANKVMKHLRCMAGLDPGDWHSPRTGRIRFASQQDRWDIILTTSPQPAGEQLLLRLERHWQKKEQ